MKKLLTLIIIILTSLTLASCTGNKDNLIVVGASPSPHAEILAYASTLLKEKGYDLEIKPFSDYITPNIALTKKQIDANFFQHEPYLDLYNKENGTDIISVAKIHIEPIGIYSKVYTSIDQVEDGATVVMSNSKADQGRLLSLLVAQGLITLKDGVDSQTAELDDIKDNPKNLVIEAKTSPELLVEVYLKKQADLVLINSNFVLEYNKVKINPGKDALVLESANDNPFANIIATIPEYKDSPKIKALVEVLTSKEVSDWILKEWSGDIVPYIAE